jgi:hypothetical protein
VTAALQVAIFDDVVWARGEQFGGKRVAGSP